MGSELEESLGSEDLCLVCIIKDGKKSPCLWNETILKLFKVFITSSLKLEKFYKPEAFQLKSFFNVKRRSGALKAISFTSRFFNVRNVKSECVNERVFPYYITIQHHCPDLGPFKNSNTRNKDFRINWSGLFFIVTLVIKVWHTLPYEKSHYTIFESTCRCRC